MPSDRERWDERFAGELGARISAPDSFVVAALSELGDPGGRSALDLASGTGRHALELAELGYATSAWDVSPVALEILAQRARARKLAVTTRAVDLTLELPRERFDVVVVVDYLDRGLYARVAELVRPGGHALLATFTDDWPGEHPSPRFRLRRGELGRGAAGMLTLRVDEERGRAGAVLQAPESPE